jgi:hypothetical protein
MGDAEKGLSPKKGDTPATTAGHREAPLGLIAVLVGNLATIVAGLKSILGGTDVNLGDLPTPPIYVAVITLALGYLLIALYLYRKTASAHRSWRKAAIIGALVPVLLTAFGANYALVRIAKASETRVAETRQQWVQRLWGLQIRGHGRKDYGGFQSDIQPDAATTVDAWTTAQCLRAILSCDSNAHLHSAQIRDAFDFIDRQNKAGQGWETLPESTQSSGAPLPAQHTRTEIAAWVAIAHIASVASGRIWPPDRVATEIDKVDRILGSLLARQDDGTYAWGPTSNPKGANRTYSTAMALWSLLDAHNTPAILERLRSKFDNSYDNAAMVAARWLIRAQRPNIGWNPNPADREKHYYLGLTAQVLYVLSRGNTVGALKPYLQSGTLDQAKLDFIARVSRSKIEPGATTDVPQNDRVIEDETLNVNFVAFPWALAALKSLSEDTRLASAKRKQAADTLKSLLRQLPEIDTLYDRGLTFELAEHLVGLGLIQSTDAAKSLSRTSSAP